MERETKYSTVLKQPLNGSGTEKAYSMGSEKKNRIFDKKFICLDDSQ